MPFVWVIRTWCSMDSFWESVRSGKEFDIAISNPEKVLEKVEKIIIKEQDDWKEISSSSQHDSRDFLVELPTVDQIKNRPFCKFLSVMSTKTEFAQNWYIERLHLKD